jgi:hypothetical protein
MTDQELIKRYKEYFLKIIIASGSDAGDIDNPDQIAFPPIEELALREVETLMEAYRSCLGEL